MSVATTKLEGIFSKTLRFPDDERKCDGQCSFVFCWIKYFLIWSFAQKRGNISLTNLFSVIRIVSFPHL